MLRARGRDLRAVLAGAIICVAGGDAAAQEGAETKEDLGSSYALARRTTGQGSIIETLIYSGRAIVTEIVVPGPGGAVASSQITGATPAATASAGRAAIAATAGTGAPTGAASGFGGTLLSAEMNGGYLVLHRIRAGEPAVHDIFHDGEKVGSVTEVASSAGGKPGRNSFAFETSGDRFVVDLTQPDGTKIHATSVHGQFSAQVVERAAAAPVVEGIVNKRLAPQTAPLAPIPNAPSNAASDRRPVAKPQPRQPAPRAAAVQPSEARPGFYGNAATPTTAASIARSKPAATVNAQSQSVAAARPVARAAKPLRAPASGASRPQGTR